MAKVHGKNAEILVDGYDLSGDGNSVTIDVSVDAAEVTCMGNTYKQYVEGIADASVDVETFYDAAASQPDAVLEALIGAGSPTTPPVVSIYPYSADTDGNIGYGMEADLTKKPITSPIGGSATMSFQMKGGILSRLKTIEKINSVGAGNGTSFDMGAAATAGAIAFLHVTAYAGFTNITVSIEESTTDAWLGEETTLLSFTANTAVGAQRKIGTGGDRYVRVVVAVTGAGTASIVVGLNYD